MNQKTPLYDQHRQAHAKMVDFGGWDMPLHYGSQLQEHHQVRQNAGMFDVSHMTLLDLTGPYATDFLRHLLANDVGRLRTPGKALYSCLLNPQGGVIDDLIVYFQTPEQFRMVVNAATRDKDLDWITQQAQHFKVEVALRDDLAMLALQGPRARELTLPQLPTSLQTAAASLTPFQACWEGDFFIGRTGYTGEDGFEIMLPNSQVIALWQQLLAIGILPIGLGARDTLRLEAGMSLYGNDLDEDHSPLESGLEWTVAFQPADRDFIGKTALQLQKNQHAHPILVGIVLTEKGILRTHQPLLIDGNEQGYITSGSFSPTLGISIGLARLPKQTAYPTVTVDIRGKKLPVKVVKPPFVRQGQACIDLSS